MLGSIDESGTQHLQRQICVLAGVKVVAAVSVGGLGKGEPSIEQVTRSRLRTPVGYCVKQVTTDT